MSDVKRPDWADDKATECPQWQDVPEDAMHWFTDQLRLLQHQLGSVQVERDNLLHGNDLLKQQLEQAQGENKRLTTLLADRIDVVWESKLRETQKRAEHAEARVTLLTRYCTQFHIDVDYFLKWLWSEEESTISLMETGGHTAGFLTKSRLAAEARVRELERQIDAAESNGGETHD